jgi:predicted nucleotidyltransferase
VGEEEDISVMLKGFKRRLEEDYEVSRIILFGSMAAKAAHEFSDVDLMIVSPDLSGEGYFERASRMYEYWDSGLPVDFRRFFVLHSRGIRGP